MTIIAPFRGVIYNPKLIPDLSQVVTPPYDVITPQQQDQYYQEHPYNIIRLDLGKNFPSDTPGDSRYTRAAHRLDIWRKDEILIQDSEPAIYLYKIRYQFPDQEVRVRTGFIARLKLEPFESGLVRPHEKTFSSHRQDRYQLLENCFMQFCPIFSFYIDPENRILSLLASQAPPKPLLNFEDRETIHHQVWRITDKATLKEVQKQFQEITVYIADGHHRYETSLAFQSAWLKKVPDRGRELPFNYTLMFLCNMTDPGLTIFPVHRALIRKGIELESSLFEKKISEDFLLEKIPFQPEKGRSVIQKFLSRLERKGQTATTFGLFMTNTSWYYLLSLKRESQDGDWGKDIHPLLRKLDVVILSRLILQKVLGIQPEDLDKENIIEYLPDPQEALKLVEQGSSQMSFILNPTPIEQVRQIAEASLIMPRKSTYFYPKTLTGLIMNSLSE